MNKQQNAKCTLSDSGTISEESAILGFPAISLRQSMERPEAQDTGSIILTGFEPEIVLSSVRTVIEEQNNSLPAVWHGLPAGRRAFERFVAAVASKQQSAG